MAFSFFKMAAMALLYVNRNRPQKGLHLKILGLVSCWSPPFYRKGKLDMQSSGSMLRPLQLELGVGPLPCSHLPTPLVLK